MGLGRLKALLLKGSNPADFGEYSPSEHGYLFEEPNFEDLEQVDRYWLEEPYSHVTILRREHDDYYYHVTEPELSSYEKILFRDIREIIHTKLLDASLKGVKKEDLLKHLIRESVSNYIVEIEPILFFKIEYYILRDYLKFGKLTSIMKDPYIEDISCNGWEKPIYVYHKRYRDIETNVVFEKRELDEFVQVFTQKGGKHISKRDPLIHATMPDGSRIQLTFGEDITKHGSTFTIRKFNEMPTTPIDLIAWKTFSPEALAYLWLAVENAKSLLFVGGTASGKTTSLNAVSLFIPYKAKIVTLEDTREIRLPHPNWIADVTRVSASGTTDDIDMYKLLKSALRQRPEYLLVGEVRGEEALTLFQAMSTGHTTFSTMHADSVETAIRRLESPPINVPRGMLDALDIISIQAQTFVNEERVRRNLMLTEIIGIDTSTRNIKTTNVFRWDAVLDESYRSGNSFVIDAIGKFRGWSAEKVEEELNKRRIVLEFMLNKDIRDFETITKVIHDFQTNPEKVMRWINLDAWSKLGERNRSRTGSAVVT
ncbi:MAG: type II/IV secretion system ATPase subunit [Candidatus Syntropharchaeales archaeon]